MGGSASLQILMHQTSKWWLPIQEREGRGLSASIVQKISPELSPGITIIALCLALFPCAEFPRTKGAVKLHLFFDHDGYFPAYAYLSNGKKHDVTVARRISRFVPQVEFFRVTILHMLIDS